MKKILPFLAPICLFASSCDELVQESVNEFYKSDRNLARAINLATQASEACLKAGDAQQAITSLINGASICMVNKEPQKALELSKRALELAAKGSDKLLLARSYHSLGAAQKAIGRYDEALASFQEALKIYDDAPNAPMHDELVCIKSIGNAYYMKNDFDKAHENHILALNLLDITPELSGNELVRSELLIEVANDLAKLNQKDEATQNYKKVLEILNGKEQNPRARDLLERANKGLKELN
ncbi:tetratricopeptide repeat protein [Campylobacter concisus]|uniref:tetratricopeptide repeat protein n=1 Tax=Campylobacter concisus TaxID=199 RepID=UPI000CD9DAF4|nr:tetratricopeptide repeat protein [Campylobacter concisus]MBE9818477.1 tetratricopeptide repeat protein [Campylobacter concisus]